MREREGGGGWEEGRVARANKQNVVELEEEHY